MVLLWTYGPYYTCILPGDWERPEAQIDYVAKFKGIEQLAMDEYVYDCRVIHRKA